MCGKPAHTRCAEWTKRLNTRRLVMLAGCLVFCILASCEKRDNGRSIQDSLASAPESEAEPARGPLNARTGSSKPIAVVNGTAIERDAIVDQLILTHGLLTLQQHILLELAKQETNRLGIKITPDMVNREYDVTLQAAQFDGKDIEQLTPARRELLIDEWTQSRGVTREELAVAIERQTHLREIARRNINITDEMLQREYRRSNGEKVEVRHLQLAALRSWPPIEQRLAAGESFEKMVRDHSQNRLSRERDGLLPPFSREDTTVPAEMIAAAFALDVGEYCNPLEIEGSFHVLKLERHIPAEQRAFDDCKDKLRHSLEARLTTEAMETLGRDLLLRCDLKIEDPVLRAQYKKRHASGDLVGPPLLGQ